MDTKKKFYDQMKSALSNDMSGSLKAKYGPKPPPPVVAPPVVVPPPAADPLADPSVLEQLKAYLKEKLGGEQPDPRRQAVKPSNEEFIRTNMGDEAWEEESQ